MTSEFEKASSNQSPRGIIPELWAFLRSTKKWWLLPFVVVMGLFGILIALASSPAAPFIYSLF